MLHEVLIVLSGYESPIITDERISFEILHPSEQALTGQIALFGKLHRDIYRRINIIQSSFMELPLRDREYAKSFFPGPYSSANHAVASTLEKELLVPFRKCLIEIEKKILARDSAYVGGENSVSLSQIAAETVKKWEKRFMYSRSLLDFITGNISRQPHVHEVVEKLRKDSIIGYQDVKGLVTECLISVEKRWLSQLSSWVLYGRLPRSEEFIIAREEGGGSFYVRESHIPVFINSSIGNEILIIGQCLYRMNIFSNQTRIRENDLKIIDEHNKTLFSTQLPISEHEFHRNITSIKLSIFKNIVARTLPISSIIQLFNLLRRVVLCGSFEFINAFLSNISDEVGKRDRYDKIGKSFSFNPQGIFKRSCAEFTEDTSNQSDGELLDISNRILSYRSLKESNQVLDSNGFEDILLGIRCRLAINIDWPLYILISSKESELYGEMFSYFMSIKCTIMKLQDIWRRNRVSRDVSAINPIASKAKIFLDNIWDYLQSFIIDANFNNLQSAIAENAQGEVDPEMITKCHNKMMKNIYTGCFVGDSKMRSHIRRLLILCNRLSEMETKDSDIKRVGNEISSLISEIIVYLSEQDSITQEINQLLVRLEGMSN